MLMSSRLVSLGGGLCSSQQLALLSHRKAEVFAKLSLRKRVGCPTHYCISNKEARRIRSNKTQVIPAAFGRTGRCLSGLEGLFVMAAYVVRKYSA